MSRRGWEKEQTAFCHAIHGFSLVWWVGIRWLSHYIIMHIYVIQPVATRCDTIKSELISGLINYYWDWILYWDCEWCVHLTLRHNETCCPINVHVYVRYYARFGNKLRHRSLVLYSKQLELKPFDWFTMYFDCLLNNIWLTTKLRFPRKQSKLIASLSSIRIEL